MQTEKSLKRKYLQILSDWMVEIGQSLGDSPDYYDFYYREKFLTKIFYQESENISTFSYKESIDNLKILKTANDPMYQPLKKLILVATKPELCSEKMLFNYLVSIKVHAVSVGVNLSNVGVLVYGE